MTVEDVVQIIRDGHGGAWWALFHGTEQGHKFLPTGHVLTPAAYEAVRAKFAPAPEGAEPGPSAAERKRNDLRAKAEAKGARYV